MSEIFRFQRKVKVEICQGKFQFYQKTVYCLDSDIIKNKSSLYLLCSHKPTLRLLLGEAPAVGFPETRMRVSGVLT